MFFDRADMKRLSLLLLLTSFSICSFAQSDSLLSALKRAIEEKNIYVNARMARIETLKKKLASTPAHLPEDVFELTNRLYFEYKVFVYDSAINYTQRLARLAEKLNDPMKREYARVKTAFTLNSAGLFKETFDTLRLVKTKFLPDSSRLEYYNLLARANFDLGEFDSNDFFYQHYLNSANRYLDSGLMLSPKNSYASLDISNYKHLMNNEIDEGLVDVKAILKFKNLTFHQRAICNHHLALLHLKAGDTLKARDAFITSSIYDLKAATKETASMAELANIFYRSGDIENAYLFIRQAMDDAQYYGARQRKAKIGSLLPIIAAESINRSEQQKRAWLTYSVMATVVFALTLLFVFITRMQYKKLKAADRKIKEANESLQEINRQLREADKIKEEYIGYYFNINSDYLDKIESLKKSIDQKLTARKFEDLRFVTDSFDLKRERENLYTGFDSTFVKLFPDFVTTFHSYFHEENKFQLKDGQVLNTEMRIFALIRLGIHDTDKIAKILGYSVNTIYAYKTKVKSKSTLPNDEFEAKILEIKTV